MFSFFKKKKPTENTGSIAFNYDQVMVDMHSHVLPGIDDGAQTVEESIVLIRKMMELGITKIIATPHIMMDLYRNTPETINAALTILKAKLVEEKMEIDISAAAEHYLDETFEQRIDERGFMTMGDNYVLFEFSFVSRPHQALQLIKKMTASGYRPILAHPERYQYLSTKELLDLREWGCLMQLNTISLCGYYGIPVKQTAQKLIDANLIDFISSDMHHPRHADALADSLKEPHLRKLLFEQQVKNKIFL